MEQLQTAEKKTVSIEELRQAFDENAMFTYYHKESDTLYTMTLDEALAVSGDHILSLEPDMAIRRLQEMHTRAESIRQISHMNPDFEGSYEETLANAQKYMARLALAESVA